MTHYIGLKLLLVAGSSLAAPLLVHRDFELLQRKWRCVGIQGGDEFEKEPELVLLQFANDTFSIQRGESDPHLKGTFRLGPSQKPRTIALSIPDSQYGKGKELLGIYEVTKDYLRLCVPVKPDLAPRPEKFENEKDNRYLLCIFKRVK